METTQEQTDADYMSLVEADKRSILEQLLTYDYDSLSNGGVPSTNAQKDTKLSGKPIDESNVKATLEEEYAKIFGDVDVDDSEEIFNNLLKKVEEEFKRQMEFKKNNPFLAASLSAAEEVDLKPERRATKRKPKAFEQSLKVMDNFKKQLLENPSEADKVRSSSSDFSAVSALVKSSRNACAPVRSQNSSSKLKSSLKIYPKWKTTSTYTPIFSAPSNPNWASIPTNIEEKKLLSQKTAKSKMLASTPCIMPASNELGLPRTMNLSKMYTSTQIRNWIHTRPEADDNFNKANNDAQLLSSSNKTFRSDQSVCNSELNNDVFSSPMKSPLDMSTPMRDTVVRFRPSPPQCFLFSSDGNSSVSSSPPVMDYENNSGEDTDFNACEYLPKEFVYCENDHVNEQTSGYFKENYYSDSPDNCPENYYPVRQPVNRREQQQFVDFNEAYHSCCNSRQSDKAGKRILNSTSMPPIPSEDFPERIPPSPAVQLTRVPGKIVISPSGGAASEQQALNCLPSDVSTHTEFVASLPPALLPSVLRGTKFLRPTDRYLFFLHSTYVSVFCTTTRPFSIITILANLKKIYTECRKVLTLSAMESKSCNNFISYVGFEEHEMQNLGSSRRNSLNEYSIKLLPGEAVVTKAENVLMFEPVSESKQGISGVLSVTNFKLTFVTADDNGDDIYQQNHLYGYTDTCLSNIDTIYLIMGDKKRKLVPGAVVPSKVKGIFIICKNLRTWSFSFKFSPLGDGKNILNALLHHAFPTKHYLLFAYEYKEPYYSSVDKEVQLFRDINDWENELDRTIGKSVHLKKGWRLSKANKNFEICPSLSEYIIVPASVTDSQLIKVAQHFQGSRPPVWCWSNEKGAALVKMSELYPSITERTQENIMLENIRKNHPRKLQPVIIELNKDITVKAVASSFSKFVHLCSPESVRQFLIQENNFYSQLESTKWLKYVSYCLQKSVEASEHLNLGVPVILQEGAGRDICCIISSLVQLLLDSYFRTITGFQTLLQKEWIAAGHPFCDRLGHLKNDGSEKSPLFLLYLDCVWQLCQQFPAEFEFTETYLTTLWDTAHVSIFETFIFNCEKDRIRAATDPTTRLVLRSVWDWREQFNDQDILLFHNPLYIAPSPPDEPTDQSRSESLKPLCSIPHLEVWSQCYFRWIPHLVINNGGRSQVEMYARLLQNDIAQLQIDANAGGNSTSPVDKISTYLLQMNINSFYPFSNKKSGNTISTPIINTSFIMSESMIDAQSLLTAPD